MSGKTKQQLMVELESLGDHYGELSRRIVLEADQAGVFSATGEPGPYFDGLVEKFKTRIAELEKQVVLLTEHQGDLAVELSQQRAVAHQLGEDNKTRGEKIDQLIEDLADATEKRDAAERHAELCEKALKLTSDGEVSQRARLRVVLEAVHHLAEACEPTPVPTHDMPGDTGAPRAE